MIIISFEKYDELYEKAEKMTLSPDYAFPSVESLRDVLDDSEKSTEEERLLRVLTAQINSTNKQYQKEVNELLINFVYMVDEMPVEEQENENDDTFPVTKQQLLDMTEFVKTLPIQCTYWYPSVEDLNNFSFKPSANDIYFLLWLINSEFEMNEDDNKAKRVASDILQRLIKIVEEQE